MHQSAVDSVAHAVVGPQPDDAVARCPQAFHLLDALGPRPAEAAYGHWYDASRDTASRMTKQRNMVDNRTASHQHGGPEISAVDNNK